MNYPVNDVSQLPSINKLMRNLQAIAMLDSILMEDWELRYFSFDLRWKKDGAMGSMRNGEGAEFYFLFDENGVAGKILDDDEIDVEVFRKQLPKEMNSCWTEPAFNITRATCFLWRLNSQIEWQKLPSRPKKTPWLAFVCDEGQTYANWASKYYEVDLDSSTVKRFLEHDPLTREAVRLMNPERKWKSVQKDGSEIGYPIKG